MTQFNLQTQVEELRKQGKLGGEINFGVDL